MRVISSFGWLWIFGSVSAAAAGPTLQSIPLQVTQSVEGPTKACTYRSAKFQSAFLKRKPAALKKELRKLERSVRKSQWSPFCPSDQSKPEVTPGSRFESDCQAEAVLLKNRFLSLALSCSGTYIQGMSSVGTQPLHSIHALVFDLKKKKKLTWSNLIKGGDKSGEARSFYLAARGVAVFQSRRGEVETIPYSGLIEGLRRFGMPTPLADQIRF